ncbi:hypothetical protein DLAC_09841 [Tieghemostelium lacteum]|uniref:EGF-like domain-containing protein n=1 Tax=Tieghemostelium lacteum TaxID=361077 RepID=A0A151Z7F7_TIELA|nr:hypothetical protein DLAC_09841 [Tieghemostelium lacteum]|eukprot:KYQ89867.1 hypothetical protein DLAC_09841 [Tieghemostelium lacteum]
MNTSSQVLLVLILGIIVAFSGKTKASITIDGVSLVNVELSSNNISWVTPYTPSVTFLLEFELENGIELSGGQINFPSPIPTTINVAWNQMNIWPQYYVSTHYTQSLTGSFNISVCVPLDLVNTCNIKVGQSSVQCVYDVQIKRVNDEISVFTYSQMVKEFPNSAPLQVNQNTKAPSVNDFQVTVHPEGPLVSFAFNLEYFGRGLSELQLTLGGSSKIPIQMVLNYFTTNNGYIYLEYLFQPATTGYSYTIQGISVTDLDGNVLSLTQSQIQNLFGVSSFQLPKDSVNSKLFTYQNDPNNPVSAQGTQWTSLLSNVYLQTPLSSLTCTTLNGYCATLYKNSTWVQVYNYILPNYATAKNNQATFMATTVDTQTTGMVSYAYQNTKTPPTIYNNATYSVSTIDQLDPFYVEINVSISLSDSVLNNIQLQIGYDIIILSPSNIFKGNPGGVCNLGTTFLMDSTIDLLDQYTVVIQDMKNQENENLHFNGPPTTSRIQIADRTYDLLFFSTVFNLSSSDSIFSTIPVMINTYSNHSDNLNSNLFFSWPNVEDDLDVYNLQSSTTDYSDINTFFINDNGYETQYQSYWTVYNQFSAFQQNGDFTLTISLKGSNFTNSGNYPLTSVCFSVIQPPFQPTLLSQVTMSPSNIIVSNQTSSIQVTIQTKGSIVNQLELIQFVSNSQNQYLNTTLSTCQLQSYSSDTLISDITCTIPVSNLPTQTIFFNLQAVIQGQPVYIPNVQLQESGFPSYIQITGPEDNGLVPNITQFSTTFNSQTNTISIQYNIENECNFVAPGTPVNFTLFSRDSVTHYLTPFTTSYNEIFITKSSFSGSFDINLCELDGFNYSFQNIGIFISINSTIAGTQYQFPYEYLVEMDPNQQNFPTNNAVCDFSGPRLVNTGVLNQQSVYNTESNSINITVYYDITDDLSGFSSLEGYVRLVGQDVAVDGFYFQEFTIDSQNLISGNLRNGRYYFNFTLPQYTNGTYQFSVNSITDNIGNQRNYTFQNIKLITKTPTQINTYSYYPNPNNPFINTLVVDNSTNTILITTEGYSTMVYMLPIGAGVSGKVYATQLKNNTYSIYYNPPNVNSGTYYFAICLVSNSLNTVCTSQLDLVANSLPNSITVKNNNYVPPPTQNP